VKKVIASFYATQRLQKRIVKHIPREVRDKDEKRPGCRGYMITKFHGMLLCASIMLRLGCLKAVDTEKNEQLHKDLVKKHVQQTQRIPGRFSSQIAQADYERVLFDRMQRHLHIHLPHEVKHLSERKSSRYDHCKVSHETQFYEDSDDYESELDASDSGDNMSEGTQDETFTVTSNTDVKLSGRFSYNIRIDRRSKRRNVNHKWVDRKKRLLNNSNPSTFIGKVLSDAHIKYCQQYKKPHFHAVRGRPLVPTEKGTRFLCILKFQFP
jgi:hypothetical protein